MNTKKLCDCTEEEYRKILEDKDIGTFPRSLNILGTEYSLEFKPATFEKFSNQEENICGLCCRTSKKIYLLYMDINYYEKQNYSSNEMREMFASTIRHEMIHAFFYESGLAGETDFAEDEILVDWIALQIPKIAKCMTAENLFQEAR